MKKLEEIKRTMKGDAIMQDIMERIKAISKRLKKEYHAQRIILFGSYARGEATEDSDVDIFIIAPVKERFFERGATVRRVVRDLYRGIPLSPIVLSQKEVEERLRRGDQFIGQILEEGIEL